MLKYKANEMNPLLKMGFVINVHTRILILQEKGIEEN